METRDILDIEGNVIGTLEMPEGTSEETWALALAPYHTPIEEPVVEIKDVTPRQIRQALILSGVTMEMIENALDALEEPSKTMARIEWEYSTAFQRDRPFVDAVAQLLGWTSEQVDALWVLAASLT